jgi:hypothetical protein
MLIELNFAETHSPIFMNGKNLGTKLFPEKTTGLKLWFNEDKDRLEIEYNKVMACTPSSSVLTWIPQNPKDIGHNHPEIKKRASTHIAHPQTAAIEEAQVEDPTGRVQGIKRK